MAVETKTGFFLDTSDPGLIAKWKSVTRGVTTNPVILAKAGVVDIPSRILEICQIVGPGVPISVEIPDTSMQETEMVEMGHSLQALFPDNAVIKVPLTPEPKPFNVISRLNGHNILTNATLGLTFMQLALAAEAGATYISMFWGRVSESHDKYNQGPEPEVLLEATLSFLLKQGLNSKVIVGSVRTPDQITRAFSLGAHVVTVPPEKLDQSFQNTRLSETITEFDHAFKSTKNTPGFKLI
ncbi:MAG: transaldolase family protein [Desulfobacteraceae bacterium]|jgi:transaldolase